MEILGMKRMGLRNDSEAETGPTLIMVQLLRKPLCHVGMTFPDSRTGARPQGMVRAPCLAM